MHTKFPTILLFNYLHLLHFGYESFIEFWYMYEFAEIFIIIYAINIINQFHLFTIENLSFVFLKLTISI